jgi:hypothetical protein
LRHLPEPGCADDGAIDAAIEALKDDLDAVAAEMKAAIRRQAPHHKATVPRPV